MAGNNHHSLEPLTNPDSSDKSQQSASAKSNDIMMAEVILARSTAGSPGKACQLAMQQAIDTSPDIFNVKSGPYKGIQVPESLRCGVFQSNIAKEAGLISPREVTVRALEFGALMKQKNYEEHNFQPGISYPDGTYIVGQGARDGTNSRHVGMVCGGRLLHTHEGKVLNQAISEKFRPGAYDSIKVYIPPSSMRRAELDPDIMKAAIST